MARSVGDACPRCGMLMIVTDGFQSLRTAQTQECLRCGHIEPPSDKPILAKGAQAQRYRDKAAEAEQMIGMAQSDARRETLNHIAETYYETADQIDQVARNEHPAGPSRRRPLR